MSKLGKRLESLRTEVQVHWSDERARRVERALGRRRKRRAVLQTAASIAALIAIVLSVRPLVPLRTASLPPRFVETALTPALAPIGELGLRDGSHVKLHDVTTQVIELPVSFAQGSRPVMSIELSRGAAHFQVVRDPARLFRVHSGRVIVEVLGTSFTVTKLGARSRVDVERGRVRVLWPGGQTELGAGENGIFPPDSEASAAPDEKTLCLPPPVAAPLPVMAPEPIVVRHHAPPPAPHVAEWMMLAREGQFDSAYQALMQRGLGAVRDPDELLLAADVARLSRHPATALAPLRRVLREHPKDPRSSLAAFTLGRTLLEDLGQPREAAEVFRIIADSDRHTTLVEDALAREVEAWSRAGDTVRARERALLYLRRFPDGVRQRQVRRHGGLD